MSGSLISAASRGEVDAPSEETPTKEVEPVCDVRLKSKPSASVSVLRRSPFDLAGAASYLNVNVRYVRRLVAERRVRYLKVGRLLRFRVEDLEAFLDSCRVEPATDRRSTRGS
jgi:excisionase family DNA binding protein